MKPIVLAAGCLALTVLASGCRRTESGRIVSDEKAQENAKAQVEQAKETVENAVAEAGETLDSGMEAAGEALDNASAKMEPRLADAAISARVKARLLADPEVNGLAIDVDTVNGVVTLNGRVETLAQRDEAVKLARTTEGVVAVNNLVQLTGKT